MSIYINKWQLLKDTPLGPNLLKKDKNSLDKKVIIQVILTLPYKYRFANFNVVIP